MQYRDVDVDADRQKKIRRMDMEKNGKYQLPLLLLLLHGPYRTLSHSQSEESQVRGGHKSVSENPAVKFSF